VQVCQKHGIAEQTFYRWKAQYGGMTCPRFMYQVL
jgi:hypothetical protein